MPILVKDHTWIQSDKMVNIRIPVSKNTYHENVDVFTTDAYVKANFSPFLFEAFLLHDVDSKKSRCLVKEDVVILDLVKREPLEWETLEKELTKPEKMKVRQEVIDKSVEEAQQETEEKRIKKTQLDRFTVQRAMDIDAKQHELMDSRREREKIKAMDALEEWRLSNEINPTPLDQKSLPIFRSIPYQSKGDEKPKFCKKYYQSIESGATVTEVTDEKPLSVATDSKVKDLEKPCKGDAKSEVKTTEITSEDKPEKTIEVNSAVNDMKTTEANSKEVPAKTIDVTSEENAPKTAEVTSKTVELPAEVNSAVNSEENAEKTAEVTSKTAELPADKKTADKPKNIPMWKPPPKGPPEPFKIPVKSEYVEKKKKEVAKRVLPKLRQNGTVEITHTPRTFPTPSRESSHEEEQTWLKNITLARRATGFISEDLRPEEQDPQWCKDKGDEFFRNGNFLAAISAYSHGITLSDKLPSLYSNRAAAHFALGNFNKCLNDCSTALELMKPACEGNRRSRAKCIARRGAALARLGYLHKGIQEMKAAERMLPEDETIKKDIRDMERAWEQNPDDG